MTDDILEPLDHHPRRSGFSLSGALLGLVLGLLLGLLYSREIDPIVVRNVAPENLVVEDKQAWVIAAAQEYAASGDLQRAVERLLEIEPDENPFDVAATTTCELIRSGQINNVTSIDVIRNLRAMYEPQGFVAECDTAAFNTPVPVTLVLPTPTQTATATITPAATKTPTQAVEPVGFDTPTPSVTLPEHEGVVYRAVRIEPFCDPKSPGILEVYVREDSGESLPGTAVELIWENGQKKQTFYTGLKPERGSDYADFQMEAEQGYRLEIVDGVTEAIQVLEAVSCDTEGTLRSFRIVVQRYEPETEDN